ncbi:MAG: arginine--tRNA ligase [Patescibacteria group bacterium]
MIENLIRKLILELTPETSGASFLVENPDDATHGDYATNVAMVLGKKLGRKPIELAEELKGKLATKLPPEIARVEVVTPGFINFFLTPAFFNTELSKLFTQGERVGQGGSEAGKKVMVEYTDPNPFKEFHIGHLMSNTIGEAISRLIASQGAEVKHACYQGDVGMHVAKAIWGSLKQPTTDAAIWGKAYALGSQAYETDELAKKEINEINKKIYDRSDEGVNKIYDAGRQVSLDYFESIYKRLGTKFDYYFFESESGPIGQKLVQENLGKVFEVSDGATIFAGEKYDLHTRVFLNSEGLPTYEAKELGLAKLKGEKYLCDRSIVITGNEVAGYFAVLKKVLELIMPELAEKMRHLPHGMLRLATGKMSSRTGNVITAENLLEEVKTTLAEKMKEREFGDAEREQVAEAVAVGAIKYSILKTSPGRDIIFDLGKSLSYEGDSGPYLQYAYVRATAVLKKGEAEGVKASFGHAPEEVSELAHRLTRFPSIVSRAATLSSPNLLVTYLTELAASWNGYYAVEKIVDSTDPLSPYRLALATLFAKTMRVGLTLLGLPIVERM